MTNRRAGAVRAAPARFTRDLHAAKDQHGLAQPHRTLRVVLPRHGGDRLHPALPAALPRREGALGPRDRDRLDPGGIVGPGAVPGRTLVGPDRLAQAVPGRRAGGGRPGDRALARGASAVWLGFLVVLFAENGICRAVVESLSGAEAAALAPKGGVGAALGALRFWKPIGIVLVALVGSWMSERYGVGAILLPLAVMQGLAVAAALLIHESAGRTAQVDARERATTGRAIEAPTTDAARWFPKDAGLWVFVAAMVLYHAANAPGGVYLGLFLKRDLHAPDRMLAYAFAVSMVAWMLVVWPAGWLADRWGRKPLLIAGWTIMAVRLGLVSVVQSPAWPWRTRRSTAWATACSR